MSSKKCTLQHQQHGQKMAVKQATQSAPSLSHTPATPSPNPQLSLADQLSIFRLLGNQSAAPTFQAPVPQASTAFPSYPNFMPFAMPQYAALLQSAANMAAACAKKSTVDGEKRQGRPGFAASSLFEATARPTTPVDSAARMFQQFLAQQVSFFEF